MFSYLGIESDCNDLTKVTTLYVVVWLVTSGVIYQPTHTYESKYWDWLPFYGRLPHMGII